MKSTLGRPPAVLAMSSLALLLPACLEETGHTGEIEASPSLIELAAISGGRSEAARLTIRYDGSGVLISPLPSGTLTPGWLKTDYPDDFERGVFLLDMSGDATDLQPGTYTAKTAFSAGGSQGFRQQAIVDYVLTVSPP
jgi:hypothetical protein